MRKYDISSNYLLKTNPVGCIFMFKRSLLFVFIIFQSACSIVGIRSEEEAKFKVLVEQGDFQLRQYSTYIVAETFIESNFDKAGSEAFGRLFSYISGDNINAQEIAMTAPVIVNRNAESSGQKIAMTAPVITEKQSKGWRYYFVLPQEFTLISAPKPTNPNVILKEISSKKVASIQFTSLWDENTFNEKVSELESWILENNYVSISLPSFAGYDPPWTLPFLRRNEVLIDVTH
jgi:hypothetical protein